MLQTTTEIMTDSALPLARQWALVTGSTRGIGRAIALELAAAGANVIVHGRDAQAAEEVCTLIRQQQREAISIVTDIGSAVARQKLIEHAWNDHAIDVWINNAGVDVLTGNAANWSFDKKLDALWQVDVQGTIDLSRAVGQRMRERGRGVVLNIGWDQAEIGMAGDSGEMFAATKGAVMAFTRSLAKSLAPEVRVNGIAPGWIRTAWGEEASDNWQQHAINDSLLKRWGEPEDVARAAAFLASPVAAFITGQIIHVNGGRA
ncbi:MAG TPA: SDR family oxidoreductase [Lacipirellula sp.]